MLAIDKLWMTESLQMLFFVGYLFSLLYQEKENKEFFIITAEAFSALYHPVFNKYKIGLMQQVKINPCHFYTTTQQAILYCLHYCN